MNKTITLSAKAVGLHSRLMRLAKCLIDSYESDINQTHQPGNLVGVSFGRFVTDEIYAYEAGHEAVFVNDEIILNLSNLVVCPYACMKYDIPVIGNYADVDEEGELVYGREYSGTIHTLGKDISELTISDSDDGFMCECVSVCTHSITLDLDIISRWDGVTYGN